MYALFSFTGFRESKRADPCPFLQSLRCGDPSAIRILVNEYGPRIHGFLRCLVPSNEMAEDLTQDVLIKVYQKCGQIESPRSFETWMFTLARNIALKEMKRKRYRSEVPKDAKWFETQHSGTTGQPFRHLSAEESALLLKEALSTLDDKRREILALRYFSGLPLQEIADVMKLPLGSIGTTIARSLESLKEYFDSRGIRMEDLI